MDTTPLNRRSFLKFAGLAPVVPALAVGALNQPLIETGTKANFPGTFIMIQDGNKIHYKQYKTMLITTPPKIYQNKDKS